MQTSICSTVGIIFALLLSAVVSSSTSQSYNDTVCALAQRSQEQPDLKAALMRAERYGHHLNRVQFTQSSVPPTGIQPQRELGRPLPFQQVETPLASGDQGASGVHKDNKAGLPDNLKAGIESLSGMSVDDVKVHYNSSKPAEFGALAYTQGTEIQVSPGEEKHLPHEAWHVVQQRQGRVEPTLLAKGVTINDDLGLEKEADVMGKQAKDFGTASLVGEEVRASGEECSTSEKAQAQNSVPAGQVAQFLRNVRAIDADRAVNWWLTNRKPKFVVREKYNKDHVLDSVSQKSAKDASEKRFEAENQQNRDPGQWHPMTWTETTEEKIKNKADEATQDNRRASTYRNQQQLTTKLKKITKRTVTPV